jgi:hypothetical protein
VGNVERLGQWRQAGEEENESLAKTEGGKKKRERTISKSLYVRRLPPHRQT